MTLCLCVSAFQIKGGGVCDNGERDVGKVY